MRTDHKEGGQITFGLALLCLVWAHHTAAAPQSSDSPEDLTPWLSEVVSKSELPAMAAAAFNSEGLLAVGVAGVRKLGADTPVEREDLWHIGSLTKSFTSTLVGLMVDREELEWDTPLIELLPDQFGGTPYRDVVLSQLLSHRSGLPANLTPLETNRLRGSGDPIQAQRSKAAATLASKPAVHPPGTGFLYSNAGYITVGAALELEAGESWERLLRREVLGPLGLGSAGFGPPGSAGELDQPLGHVSRNDGKLVPLNPGPWADNAPVLGPAGTLHMSIGDLARYGREHLRAELGRSEFLQTETARTLHRRVDGGDYAMGWVDETKDWKGERRVVWHNGSNTMWYAFVAFAPESDLGVTVVTNGSIAGREAVEKAAAELFGEWLEEEGR